MVQQTRRVVENYIFHKLQSTFSPENYILSGVDNRNKEEIKKIFNDLSLSRNSSQIDLTVQKLACQFEKKYKDAFPELLDQLRNANTSVDNVDQIFSKVSKELFQLPLKPSKIYDKENGNFSIAQNGALDDSHIKWGHVIALLIFAGILAVRAVELHSIGTPDHIVSWVTAFFDTQLSQWFAKQGGWEGIVEWKSGGNARPGLFNDEFDFNNFKAGIGSLVSVGVVAACVGLGALLMAKK